MIKSNRLPWPPVILAIISLPQKTMQTTPLMRSRTMIRMILVMILRFLDTVFFAFLGLEVGLSGVEIGSLAAVRVWLSALKSKTWMGVKKSALISAGVFEVGVSGVGLGA